MIKAVLSSSSSSSNGTGPSLTFKSNTLEGSDSKTYETRIEQSRPFFSNPFAEKLSGLERSLRAIMTGKMNDEQKLILYKNSLNDIFLTDRMRKINARRPEQKKERAAPPAQVPQPAAAAAAAAAAAVAELPAQAPPPAQLGAIPKKRRKRRDRSPDLGDAHNKYKTGRLVKIARRRRGKTVEEEEEEDPAEAVEGEPPARRPRLPPVPARRSSKRKSHDPSFPDYPSRRTRSKTSR